MLVRVRSVQLDSLSTRSRSGEDFYRARVSKTTADDMDAAPRSGMSSREFHKPI